MRGARLRGAARAPRRRAGLLRLLVRSSDIPRLDACAAEMVVAAPRHRRARQAGRVTRFSYYTRHPREVTTANLFGKSVPNRHLRDGFPSTNARSTTKTAVPAEVLLDIARPGRRQRLPRPRRDAREPRRGPARLLRRHRRATRSSRCGSATCAPARTSTRWSPAATTAAPGAPTRRGSSTPSTTRPTGPCQVWRHRLGTPVSEDVLVLERARRALRAHRSGDPQRRRHPDLSESRDTGETWVVDAHRPGAGARGRSAAAGPACSTAPSTCGRPGGRSGTAAAGDQRRRGRVPADGGAGAADGDQDASAWTEVRPEDPAERLERVDAFAGGVVLSERAGGEHRLRIVAHDDLAGARSRGHQPVPRRRGRTSRATRRTTPAAVTVAGPRLRRAPGLVGRRPGHRRRRATSAARRRPGHDPAALRRRDAVTSPRPTALPSARPWSGTGTRRSTAPPRALVYGYGAYESTFEPEWDPALPSLLDRGVVFVARARPRRRRGRPRAGGSTAGWAQAEHVRRLPRGRRRARRARRRGPDRDPRALAPAACSRARCSASGRSAGGPWWPRCRSSTW